MKKMKTLTINNNAFDIVDDGAIRFDGEQDLSSEQQAQARENIGASGIYIGPGDMPDGYSIQIDPDGQPIDLLAVTYTPQTLTREQKAQARENIGALSHDDITN